MSMDILIYAVLAIIILARLWMVFGRRNEEDRERPNPFITPSAPPTIDDDAFADPAQAKPSLLLKSLVLFTM